MTKRKKSLKPLLAGSGYTILYCKPTNTAKFLYIYQNAFHIKVVRTLSAIVRHTRNSEVTSFLLVSAQCWRRPLLNADKIPSTLTLPGTTGIFFLPRNSVLARLMLSSSVRPSVCHKPVLCRNDWTNRAGIWHESFLPHIPHCVVRKFGYLLSGTLSQTSALLTNRLRKFRHGKLIALSTTCRRRRRRSSLLTAIRQSTIDESWLFTTSRSTVSLTL